MSMLTRKSSLPSREERRRFRPALEACLDLLEQRTAPSSIFELNPTLPLGTCEAIAWSRVWLSANTLVDQQYTVNPNGGTTSSEAEGLIVWDSVDITRPPTIMPGITAREMGLASTGVSLGSAGGTAQEIIVHGSHQHIDTLTAGTWRPFYNLNGAGARQTTIVRSSSNYNYDVKGPNGQFDPSTTITFDISLSVQPGSDPRFIKEYAFQFASTHFTVLANINGRGSGLQIRDPNGNMIDSDPGFGTTSFSYQKTLTFQASNTESIAYFSQYDTFPQGGPWSNETAVENTSVVWDVGMTLS